MKRISFIITVFMFSSYAVYPQKQVLNSTTTPRQIRTTIQQPAKNTTVKQGTSKLMNVFPIPKKIMVLTKFKNLSLLSEKISPMKTMDNNISKKPSSTVTSYGNQKSRVVESGILGMTSKNFGNGPKVNFALTNNTYSWSSNPSYSIKTKSSNNE